MASNSSFHSIEPSQSFESSPTSKKFLLTQSHINHNTRKLNIMPSRESFEVAIDKPIKKRWSTKSLILLQAAVLVSIALLAGVGCLVYVIQSSNLEVERLDYEVQELQQQAHQFHKMSQMIGNKSDVEVQKSESLIQRINAMEAQVKAANMTWFMQKPQVERNLNLTHELIQENVNNNLELELIRNRTRQQVATMRLELEVIRNTSSEIRANLTRLEEAQIQQRVPLTLTSSLRPNSSITCSSNHFICDNGLCIDLNLKCDNFEDCGDGSDEDPQHCRRAGCPGVEFKPNNLITPSDKLFDSIYFDKDALDICRFNHSLSGDTVIGRRYRTLGDRDCRGSYQNSTSVESANQIYEVLVHSGASLKWVKKSAVPDLKRAIVAGTSGNGDNFYVGRCSIPKDSSYPGRIQGGRMYYTSYSNVLECNEEYEYQILVCD